MVEIELKRNHDPEIIRNQKARRKMLELVNLKSLPHVDIKSYIQNEDIKRVEQFYKEFEQLDENDPNNEQIKLSLKYWNAWGAHYLRSFVFAHKFEQCLNFKSPSMKIYCDEKFNTYVDDLTDVFCRIPPPKPTGHCYSGQNMPQITVNNIMDRNNGCILGSCKAKLLNNTFKNVSDLAQNDLLANGAQIVCVIKSQYSSILVKLNGLVITPYHPIIYENKWQFPIEIATKNESLKHEKNSLWNPFCEIIQNDKTESVFNFVLDQKHIMSVEGFECVTLGHGLEEDVVRHYYYGTNKVIEDLSKLDGWKNGFIDLENFYVQRDAHGVVSGTYGHECKINISNIYNTKMEKMYLC